MSLPCSRWRKYLGNDCGLALLTSVQLLTYLGFIPCYFKSNNLWVLGFDFFHTPPPQSTITQILHNPFDLQLLSWSWFKHVYDSFSWVGKMVGNNVCSSKTWHKQTSDSARSPAQQNMVKNTKAVIQCLFLWQQLFCSLYYLTQHDHTTRCSDFWKNKTVQPWAKRNQSDSKLHKL